MEQWNGLPRLWGVYLGHRHRRQALSLGGSGSEAPLHPAAPGPSVFRARLQGSSALCHSLFWVPVLGLLWGQWRRLAAGSPLSPRLEPPPLDTLSVPLGGSLVSSFRDTCLSTSSHLLPHLYDCVCASLLTPASLLSLPSSPVALFVSSSFLFF